MTSAGREYTVIIEEDDEGYLVAEVPALRGCYTQARTFDQLMSRVREAIAACLDEPGHETPPLRFVGVQRVTV